MMKLQMTPKFQIFLFIVIMSFCLAAESEEDLPKFQTEQFTFESAGNTLDGLLDVPKDKSPSATIIIVHGYGKTNVVEQNWFYNLRSRFTQIGLNVVIWDKPGCGSSEGEFDINQPVASSADEVVAAVKMLRESKIKGSEKIGLWGISRAGWIAPLAMKMDTTIAFWISISGTDDKENGRYLIYSNLLIEGRSQEEADQLIAEWQNSFNTLWQNGTYEQYLAASPNLSNDPFMKLMNWDGYYSREDFEKEQAKYNSGEILVDREDELMIYVPDFKQLLSSIGKPVLAMFGEKDTNVDWRKTLKLYQETIGANPNASLTIKSFPNANHILKQCDTGGIREMNQQAWDAPYAEGYYKTMLTWLQAQNFEQDNNITGSDVHSD